MSDRIVSELLLEKSQQQKLSVAKSSEAMQKKRSAIHEVVSGITQSRTQRERWRAEVWGQLEVLTTDDPDFQPTHPLPTKKKGLRHSRMSKAEYRGTQQVTVTQREPDTDAQAKEKVVSIAAFEASLE